MLFRRKSLMAGKSSTDLTFWILFVLSISFGLYFSDQLKILKDYVIYIQMVILFIAFLKIDLSEIAKQLKRPKLLAYVLLIYMIVIPAIIYFLSLSFSNELMVGLFLLAVLPVGTAAPPLTSVLGGKSSLSLILTILSTLLSIVSIPLMFLFFFKTQINLDYVSVIFTLFKLIVIPLFFSETFKRLKNDGLIKKINDNSSILILILLFVIIAIVIAVQTEYITGNLAEIAYHLVVLYVAFILFQFIGYFMVFWLKKDEKITISSSKVFNNAALGITLALAFFDAKVALILVLSEIPWITMVAIFNWSKKYLP